MKQRQDFIFNLMPRSSNKVMNKARSGLQISALTSLRNVPRFLNSRCVFFLVLFMVLFLFFPRTVCAKEQEDALENIDGMLDLEDEYASIQKIIDDNKENSGFEFRSKVAELASGDAKFSFQTIGEQFVAGIRAEAGTGKKNVTFLIAAGLAGGMLGALSKLFLNRQAAAMGFYMLYLLLFSVLSAAFTELVTLAGTVFSMLLQFMKVLLPAYFLAIAFCTGTRTSYVFYETMVIIITVLEIFIMNIILPAIRIYFVLGMVHHLSEKPFAGSILELLEKGIRGSIKIVFLIVISIQGIEGMLAPFADAAAKSVILKTVGAIPGIGTGIAGVAESILKSGMLLKNAIGIAGVLGIVFLCAYPIGKMVFYTLLYHFSAAAVEAVAEPGVLGCISCSARAAGLLLYTVCTGVLLFMLTIGITLASTNI